MSIEREKPQKAKDDKYIALKITPDRVRFCNECSQPLLSDYTCGRCGIAYTPDQAEHEIKILGLDGKAPGPKSGMIPIATIDSPSGADTKKERKMARSFEALTKSGYKFTSYSETNT